MDHEFPEGFKPVNIESYDGTTDPAVWIEDFLLHIHMAHGDDLHAIKSMPNTEALDPVSGKSHLKEVLWLRLVWIAYWIARVKSTAPPTSQPITPTENAGCSSRSAS